MVYKKNGDWVCDDGRQITLQENPFINMIVNGHIMEYEILRLHYNDDELWEHYLYVFEPNYKSNLEPQKYINLEVLLEIEQIAVTMAQDKALHENDSTITYFLQHGGKVRFALSHMQPVNYKNRLLFDDYKKQPDGFREFGHSGHRLLLEVREKNNKNAWRETWNSKPIKDEPPKYTPPKKRERKTTDNIRNEKYTPTKDSQRKHIYIFETFRTVYNLLNGQAVDNSRAIMFLTGQMVNTTANSEIIPKKTHANFYNLYKWIDKGKNPFDIDLITDKKKADEKYNPFFANMPKVYNDAIGYTAFIWDSAYNHITPIIKHYARHYHDPIDELINDKTPMNDYTDHAIELWENNFIDSEQCFYGNSEIEHTAENRKEHDKILDIFKTKRIQHLKEHKEYLANIHK